MAERHDAHTARMELADVPRELAALGAMTAGQLADKYRELYGDSVSVVRVGGTRGVDRPVEQDRPDLRMAAAAGGLVGLAFAGWLALRAEARRTHRRP